MELEYVKKVAPKDLRRRAMCHFLISESEHSAIKYIADLESINFSEACRMLIREALKERGIFVGNIDKIREAVHE